MTDNSILEICCNSAQSALAAFKGGAHRIELCENLEMGGTTPSFATIQITREIIPIPIHVLLRPRTGDFLYSDIEFRIICREIEFLKDIGIDGIVVGFLQPDYSIDYKKVEIVKSIAGNLSLTFHRAFDFVRNPEEAIYRLIDLGVDRILTSGGKQFAYQSVDRIRQWVNLAGEELTIMPGSGINEKNIIDIFLRTGAKEFHASCKSRVKSSMNPLRNTVSMGSEPPEEVNDYLETDAEQVKSLVSVLNRISKNQ